jgi:mannonate dehydratase
MAKWSKRCGAVKRVRAIVIAWLLMRSSEMCWANKARNPKSEWLYSGHRGSMDRRTFLTSTSSAGLLLASPFASESASAASSDQPTLMKLGDQTAPTNDAHLAYLARYSVRNICGYPDIRGDRLYPIVDELKQMVDLAGKYGISVDCAAPPFLESSHIDQEKHPAIMLAQSPERDRDIEALQIMIRNCATAGVPSIKYNMSLLGVIRTGRTPGRGDALYSTWKLSEAHPDHPLTKAGQVNAEVFWERITYFLDRVIPVANEYKVRMACHPHDPGVPPEGYQGIVRVLGTVDGLKKFVSIQEGPYHGLNFCQGTVTEMLERPREEIFDVIRYFGTRKKIFNVHFRNIRGRRNDFLEVYPDEGDIDFVKALRVYKEVGYPYMLMPDHVPLAHNDPGGLQSFAFCYGYIRGLLASLG